MRTTKTVEYQRGEATRMKRVGYAAMFFLAGILFPVLIWVALFVAIRQPLVRAARRVGSVMLALLLGMLAPILIWVGLFLAIRYLLLWWREERLQYTMAWGEAISKIKVLVVDDHTTVRDGILAMLAQQPDMQVVGGAANGREALEKTVELHPDVVLMDIRMPEMNGFDTTREICRKYPEVKVLMLTQYDEEENILASRQVGALGFIPKKAASSLLLTGIRTVNQGKQFIRSGVN